MTVFRASTPRRCAARWSEFDHQSYPHRFRCNAAAVAHRDRLVFRSGKKGTYATTTREACCCAHGLLWDWELRLFLRSKKA